MAKRTRSLNELPGHLRVPILKRKDTERTQARLEAGLAGMEELRVLREKQQQLVGDTMAASAGHQHSLQRRHSDNSLLTAGSSKMSRSSGPTFGSSHGSVSSWQSATSLASISEEGDGGAFRDIDKNNNDFRYSPESLMKRENQFTKPNVHRRSSCDDIRRVKVESRWSPGHHRIETGVCRDSPPASNMANVADHNNQSLCPKQKHQTDNQRSWWSQEDLRHNLKMNGNIQSPARAQNAMGHRDMKGRRMSASSVVSSPSPISTSRRNSTSAVHDLQAQEYAKSFLKGKMINGNHSRSPLSSISNIPSSNADDHHQVRSDRNSSNISWDNLLKSIGISGSTSSLSLPDEDENSDVFCSSPNQDISSGPRSSLGKVPHHKLGRSLSFSYGNPMEYARNNPFFFRQVSTRNGSIDGTPEQSACSSPYGANPDHSFKPIMRRASMQCEAVLTHSDMAKRVLNPIQDMDINNLMSPGPLHAVMLQYTSRENLKASGISPESESNKNNQLETDGEHSKTLFHKNGNESEVTEGMADFNNSKPNANVQTKDSCLNNNINRCKDIMMENSNISENNDNDDGHKRYYVSHRQETSREGNYVNNKDSLKNNPTLRSVSPNSVHKDCSNYTSKENINEVPNSSADPLAKMPAFPNGYAATSSLSCVNRMNESSKSSEMIDTSGKARESNMKQSERKQDECATAHDLNSNNTNRSPSSNIDTSNATCDTDSNGCHRHLDKTSKSATVHPDEKHGINSEVIIHTVNVDRIAHHIVKMATQSVRSHSDVKDNHNIPPITTRSTDDIRKLTFSIASSDVSVISDEGYSTCDSVGPFSKIGSLSSKSISPMPEDNCIKTMSTPEQKDSAKIIPCLDHQESAKVSEQQNSQQLSGGKDFKYDGMAKLEEGVAIVWNPECSNKAQKSLRHCAMTSKSFKQTAV